MTKPWWWPVPINEEYFQRLRKEYPERAAEMSNDELLDYYNDGWEKFSDTWDHLGEAREEYEKLAEAFLKLVEETGKTPEDFK